VTRPAPGDRLRVLHLIKGLDIGGAERLVGLLAQRASPRVLAEVAYVLRASDQLVPALRENGVVVHDLGAQGQYDLRWLPRLRGVLRGGRYDIVHLHLPYSASLGRLIAWSVRPRPRLVHTQHNLWADTQGATRTLSRLTWRLDDAEIAVSEAVRDGLPGSLGRRCEVILHGIDVDAPIDPGARARRRAELQVATDELLIVTVANLRSEKGYDVLLPAAAELLEADLPVRFAAVGHGPAEGEVRALHEELGLGDRFHLLGLRTDVAEILAAADIFVLASHTEGFPVAVMEAFAAGLPVIATSVGHLPLVIRNGENGLLVPPGDVAALARALRSLLTSRANLPRMAAVSRSMAADFDIRSTADRVEAIYHDVTRRR